MIIKVMNKKQRELLEVLVDKHRNGEHLDTLDKNALWFLINEYKKTNEYVDESSNFSKIVDMILSKGFINEKQKNNKN